MNKPGRPESAGMTWGLYLLYGGGTVVSVVHAADDCWPIAGFGVVVGWLLGAFFLAYYVPHLHEGVDRWLRNREKRRTRQRRRR